MGGQLFPHSAVSPCAEFLLVHPLHGGDECGCSAIIAESTLSFMGLGLPIEVVTWGSMLSLAEKALMTDAWWILLIPGAFLVVTLLCITNLGDYLHSRTSRKESNL